MNTEIIAVIDRSGSMHSIVNDAIGGFNKFLEDQKKVEGEARMSLVLFDNLNEFPYTGTPLAEVKPLDHSTFVPRGGTALYDALGMTINQHRERIIKEGWAKKVIVCILTDGEENSSKEYKRQDIHKLITEAEKFGWEFIFLAAGQDAFAVGGGIGIRSVNIANFAATSKGTQEGYDAMSNMTSRSRAIKL